MSRLYKDKDRIERLFCLCGVDNTEKTYENILMFLETYADMMRDMKYFPRPEKNFAAWRSAPELFRAMLGADKISQERIEEFIEDMLSGGGLEDLINSTLEKVLDFSREGEDYHKILLVYYFGETTYRGAIAEEQIGLSHSTIQRKKKLAIKLFGVLFWQNMLTYWNNSIEEMYAIEIEEGRDGSLSKKMREEADRRINLCDRRKGDRRHGDRRMIVDRRITALHPLV